MTQDERRTLTHLNRPYDSSMRRRRPSEKRVLPRVPLPRQTGGPHEDKTKRPFRRRKHKKQVLD
jgi:hypothetical protein